MSDFASCTRSLFVDFSLIYEDLSNIHTTKIADYMAFDASYSSLGLSVAMVRFYVYPLSLPYSTSEALNPKAFVNIRKTKSK